MNSRENFSFLPFNSGRIQANSITSCYLIDLCRLCGTNPPRGQCILAYNESKCECLRENKNDSSRPYVGDFCWPSEPELIKTPSIPSRWIPIIIGILSGLTGLFCLITCCLWAMAIWRQRNKLVENAKISSIDLF